MMTDQQTRDHEAAEERAWQAALERSRQAKAADRLEGRILAVYAADGYAVYVVRAATGNQVALDHLNLFDGYQDSVIEAMVRVLPDTAVTRLLEGTERILPQSVRKGR